MQGPRANSLGTSEDEVYHVEEPDVVVITAGRCVVIGAEEPRTPRLGLIGIRIAMLPY